MEQNSGNEELKNNINKVEKLVTSLIGENKRLKAELEAGRKELETITSRLGELIKKIEELETEE